MALNSDGIAIGEDDLVPWSEIHALHVTEVDTMTASATILQLEHESGRYVEISELDDSYSDALKDLALFLPLDDNWTRAIQGLESRTSITIWQRQA